MSFACYEEGVAPLTRGCSAQSWDANSSESCAWKFRVIWSSVLPMGGPEGLNTQAHSEQPHPITLSSLIHTVLRDELSWPGVGTQHLTSGQRYGTQPYPIKRKPGLLPFTIFYKGFPRGTGRCQGSAKVNCCNQAISLKTPTGRGRECNRDISPTTVEYHYRERSAHFQT